VAGPPLFAHWVWTSVQEEYRLGYRTTTDGDSIIIPEAGFTILLLGTVIVTNAVLGLYYLIRRWRTSRAAK